MVEGGAHPRRRSRICGTFSAAWSRAGNRRALRVARDGRDHGKNRAHVRRIVLSRRAGAGDGRALAQVRRRSLPRRLRDAQLRLGATPGARLPRLHHPRDSSQRPGHRRIDGAGDTGEFRSAGIRRRLDRGATPRDRGDEACLRRRVSLCRRSPRHDRDPGTTARPELSRKPRAADRSFPRAGLPARSCRRRRVRSTSPLPTRAA